MARLWIMAMVALILCLTGCRSEWAQRIHHPGDDSDDVYRRAYDERYESPADRMAREYGEEQERARAAQEDEREREADRQERKSAIKR